MGEKAGFTPDADQSDATDKQGTDFKVMHIVDIDQRSSCEPLRQCLTLVKQWSDAHPNHLPVYIDLETKQDVPLPGGSYPSLSRNSLQKPRMTSWMLNCSPSSGGKIS